MPFGRDEVMDTMPNKAFFVTLCTKNKEAYFGKWKPEGAEMEKTLLGALAADCWKAIPFNNSFVKLDVFVVLPNHIHGILVFEKPFLNNQKDCTAPLLVEAAAPSPLIYAREGQISRLPKRQNILSFPLEIPSASVVVLDGLLKFGPQSKIISTVLRGYKAAVKTEAIKKELKFSWQPRYHERSISDKEEYEALRAYILNYPKKYHADKDMLEMYRREYQK